MQWGNFSITQWMDNDFIRNPEYDGEIFKKVYSMRWLENWKSIYAVMEKEYMMKWVSFKRKICYLHET